MQQVLVNLIINAIEASTDKRSYVFLSIFCKELNHKLVISLEDNGQGIANMDN